MEVRIWWSSHLLVRLTRFVQKALLLCRALLDLLLQFGLGFGHYSSLLPVGKTGQDGPS